MVPSIFLNWSQVDEPAAIELFNKTFSFATVKPNSLIYRRLANIGRAAIEIMENRKRSTTYRIRQTDEVFYMHLEKTVLTCTEAYHPFEGDSLISLFPVKRLKFKLSLEGSLCVVTSFNPLFSVKLISENSYYTAWHEEVEEDKKEVLVKKALAFYKSYAI